MVLVKYVMIGVIVRWCIVFFFFSDGVFGLVDGVLVVGVVKDLVVCVVGVVIGCFDVGDGIVWGVVGVVVFLFLMILVFECLMDRRVRKDWGVCWG